MEMAAGSSNGDFSIMNCGSTSLSVSLFGQPASQLELKGEQ